MAKRNSGGTFWLAVVARRQGCIVCEAEAGYKPCCRPGLHRVWLAPNGPVCPGCERACRIPATANCLRGDSIKVLGKGEQAA